MTNYVFVLFDFELLKKVIALSFMVLVMFLNLSSSCGRFWAINPPL